MSTSTLKFLIVLTVMALLGVLTSNSFAAVSKKTAVNIYYKIVKANKFWIYPKIRFTPSNKVNAYANATGIYINRGMLRFARNNHELAIVIGHELAHYRGADRGFNYSHSREFRADYYGKLYARKAGFNVCRGVYIIKRLNTSATPSHPSSKLRFNRLKCK